MAGRLSGFGAVIPQIQNEALIVELLGDMNHETLFSAPPVENLWCHCVAECHH
jgi:hypothetical protein